MPNFDSSNTNDSKRANRIYKDLDLNFGRNPVNNDVNKLSDVEAVKRSVRNLIQTSHFERPFEPMTPLTALNLQRKVNEVLDNWEPRIKLVQILARPDIDRNSYHLTIMFYVIGSMEPITVETFLERLR